MLTHHFDVTDPKYEGTDTDAFIKAIEDAERSHGIVIIPSGTYTITKPINLPSGVSLLGVGGGSRLVTQEGEESIVSMIRVRPKAESTSIRNLIFDGTYRDPKSSELVPLRGDVISFIMIGEDVKDCIVEGCLFKNGPRRVDRGAIFFHPDGHQSKVCIKDNEFIQTHRSIYIVAPVLDVTIEANRFHHISTAAVYIHILDKGSQDYLSKRVRIAENRIWEVGHKPTESLIEMSANPGVDDGLVFHENPVIEKNEIVGKRGTFYPNKKDPKEEKHFLSNRATGTAEMYKISRGVVGASIFGNVAKYSGDCGFTLGCNDSRIIGNHAEGCDHAGIYCQGNNNVIANNVCIANGKRHDSGGTGKQGNARSGVVINGQYNLVNGNICFDDDRYPEGDKQSWGIQLRAAQPSESILAAKDNYIDGNLLHSHLCGDIYDWASE